MEKIGLVTLLILIATELFSQCIQEPKGFNLDNSPDTIELTGRCGNPLDESKTDFLEPDKFVYTKNFNNFLIDCGFTKNCGRAASLIIQSNDTSINIYKHEVDTGEATACEAYERFVFWFPLPPSGYFHININGFDTIISGLTSIKDFNSEIQHVYPNPFESEITIRDVEHSGWKTIKIINLKGELIYLHDFLSNTQIVNTSQFLKGVYFVQIINKESGKILVTNEIIKN